MKSFKINKIIAFFSLILLLVFSFMLFSSIRNTSLNLPEPDKLNVVYVYIIFIVLFGLILFIISINLTYKNLTGEVIANEEIIDTEEEKISDEDINVGSDDKLNITQISKKIIPKEDPSKNLEKYSEKILSNIAKELDIVQGMLFYKNKQNKTFQISGKYAYYSEEEPIAFKEGETLPGQAAKNKKLLNLTELPDDYITILSGLGSSYPKNLIIIPILSNNKTIGIIELASFKVFDKNTEKILTELANLIGENVKTLIT